MGKFSFRTSERLAKRHQFEQVIDQGQKHRTGTFCTIFFLPNDLDRKRLGIIASKKIGNAVARNLTKRKIREVFRHIKGRIEPAMDIVIISGRDLVSLPVSVIEKKIFQSLPVKR
jgi:ribonuclease P protein component